MPSPSQSPENPYQSPACYASGAEDASGLPSRKGLIQVMGIAAILGGIAFGCLGGFYCFFIPGYLPASPNGSDLMNSTMISTGLLMASIAGALLWLGIGTVRLRRWAGALFLASGWLFGTIAVGYAVLMAFLMPSLWAVMSASIPENAKVPNQAAIAKASMLLGMGFVLFIYLVPPIVAVLVFRLKSVKATLRRTDPGPSWTDGMPLPVLISWVWMAMAAVSMLGMAPGYGPMYRVMGLAQHDWQAIAAMLALAGMAGLSAWGIFRREPWSWYGCFALALLMGAAALVMVSRADYTEFYKQMGMSDAQRNLALHQSASIYKGPAIVMSVALIGFLLATKRFFRFHEKPSMA